MKVIKATKLIGQANESGTSYADGVPNHTIREAFMDIQQKVRKDGYVTAAPARVYIVVEQDVMSR